MAETRTVRDRGFTLTEVLIVVTVMGLIALVIGAVFSVIVRTTPSTEARVDDARSLLGVSTWLPGDVNSTPQIPVGASDIDGAAFDRRPGVASGCADGDVGENVLRLTWTETLGSTMTFTASYRLVEGGTGWNLVRVACVNGGSASRVNLTAGLPPPADDPVFVSYRVVDGIIMGVVLDVTTVEGDQLQVDTVSQNPNETLPPLSDVVVDPTTPPSEEPEITDPPTATDGVCAAVASGTSSTAVVPPTPVTSPLLRNATDAEGPLTSAVRVDARVRYVVSLDPATFPVVPAWCDSVRLEYQTGTGTLTTSLNVTATCAEEVAGLCTLLEADVWFELPNHSSQLWITGSHPARLIDGGGTTIIGSDTNFAVDVDPATVPVPCVASFSSVSPNPMRNTGIGNNGNATVGPLRDTVTVTVTKGPNCGNLGLEYVHDPPSTGWLAFGATSQVPLERNTQLWRDGSRELRLRDGQDGPVLATTTLTIT